MSTFTRFDTVTKFWMVSNDKGDTWDEMEQHVPLDQEFSKSIISLGQAAPAVSGAGEGKFYFDSTRKLYLASENAGIFVPTVARTPRINLIRDSTQEIWAAGDSAVPTCYSITGTGPTIARCGTGLADTTRKYGKFCSKVTYGSDAARLVQAILNSTDWEDSLDPEYIGFGVAIKASAASKARAFIYDGSYSYSSYNVGTDWEWLEVYLGLSSPTELTVGVEIDSSGSVYVSGMTALFDMVPSRHIPGIMQRFNIGGFSEVPSDADSRLWHPYEPCIIDHVFAHAVTAPSSTALAIDFNHYDGSSWTSMLGATKLEVAASANLGNKAVDGDYRYRCFNGCISGLTDAAMEIVIDAASAAENVYFYMRGRKALRPFEVFNGYNG